MGKRTGALLLAIPLSGAGIFGSLPKAASAGTAKTFTGAEILGAIPAEQTELILEKQKLEFGISSLGTAPVATMSAEYTIYNPSDEEISVPVIFPFCGAVQGERTVALNGEAVACSVRHSYVGYYDPELIEENFTAVREDAGFYADPALPVKGYVFTVAGEPSDGRPLSFSVSFDCNPAKTRVLSQNRMVTSIENGRMKANFSVSEGDVIELVVAGEDLRHLDYGLYRNTYGEAVPSQIGLTEWTSTFSEYAGRTYPADTDISPEDWRKGFASMLARGTHGFMVSVNPGALRKEAFIGWYEYTLTLPPETRSVHTVSAPVTCSVNEARGEYTFTYLLSAETRWREVGEVAIEIRTPYLLTYSSLQFEQGEGVYTFGRDCLPLGDLAFTLAAGSPEAPEATQSTSLSPNVRLAVILSGTLGGIAVIIGAIAAVLIVKKKRKH